MNASQQNLETYQDIRLCFCSYPWTAGADFTRSDMRHATLTTVLTSRSAWVRAVAVVLGANVGRWSA